MTTAKTIEVTIMGQKLQIRSLDADEAYVAEIAKYVDKRIGDVLSKTKGVASTQVLILAAMNIVDEYFKCRKREEARREALAKKIESIIEHIDLHI
jgi:cell division protein ZapA